MAEKMRKGVIRRGKTYSYVVVERGHFPVMDRITNLQKVDAAGQPFFKSTRQRWVGGFRTRKLAEESRDAARHSVNRGTYVAPQDLTVSAWLDKWITGHEVELKPSTAASYRAQIERNLKPAVGHERLQSLSPSGLSVVWRTMFEKGGHDGKPLSVRTVQYARSVLRRAINDAVVERAIEVNPVVGSKCPKADGKPKHTTWTGEQVKVFLDHMGDDRWAPLWHLATATGMRRGELALRWVDVDLDGAVVSVERSTTQVGRDRITTTPKNHERRKIGIDEQTVAALRSWRKAQAAERLSWGPAYVDEEGLVFTWENGSPVLPDYLTKVWIKVQRAVGERLVKAELEPLPRLTLHELRHSHATILLRAGVPVHIVAKRLGHKDPSVTLNVYADAIPDDDTSAVDVFAKAVWGA
jgi:integrase